MTRRRTIARAVRFGARRGWAGVRPGALTDLRIRAGAVAPRDGTAPRPDQVFVPETTATGPWAGIDPLVADPWYSRAAALTSLALWTLIGFRVRRGLRDDRDGGDRDRQG